MEDILEHDENCGCSIGKPSIAFTEKDVKTYLDEQIMYFKDKDTTNVHVVLQMVRGDLFGSFLELGSD